MHRLVASMIIGLFAGCVSPAIDAERIADGERSGICPLHHVQMDKKRVRITYGLVAGPPEKVRKAQLSLFPFARRPILGGCVSMTVVGSPELSSPEFGELFVCEACNQAKARWIQQNAADPWAHTPEPDEPNKAPEPTPTAGTSAAKQPRVPAAVVAHL